MKYLIAFISALLFSLGLSLSGMLNPENVVGFLDILGDWKPALALVMGGGILVHSLTYKAIIKRESPLLSTTFLIPTNTKLDLRLITGSILFGIGWGLSGLCPGPALTSLVTGRESIIVFCLSMLTGMFFFQYVFKPFFIKS